MFAYLLSFSFVTDVKLIEYLHTKTKCFTLIKLIIFIEIKLWMYIYGRIDLGIIGFNFKWGISVVNLYNVDNALAVETSCDAKIHSLSRCPSGYYRVGSIAIASAKAPDVDKKTIDIDIDTIDTTSGTSQVEVRNDQPKSNDKGTDTESLIPSTINAIPFP